MTGLPVVAEAEVHKSVSIRQVGSRYQVELCVYPDEKGKFADNFQELVEWWERVYGKELRPVETVAFEPLREHGMPWVMHPTWEPPSKDKLSLLYTESRNIFRERRWTVIDRAISLRERD